MNRRTKFAPKEFYHLYNRGTEKRDVFMSKDDYERFLALIYFCNQPDGSSRIQDKTLSELIKIKQENNNKQLIDISSYCLMPNHFHILAREKEENGISKFMQKVITGYTMYFNKKHERTGALFQGKFKATHVNEDRYLSYLISYIHLNPIKLIEPEWKEIGINDLKQAEKYLDNFKYSSYQDFLGRKRFENAILNKDSLPKYFNSSFDFKKSIIEWLSYPHARLDLGELGDTSL
ncbi:MAG: transposase [Candidatus Taylorbacteria bacterium]|nr:transposase [Candidatus Taylorbacteria bacterium]